MTVINEGRHAAEFIVSEANGYRSRATVTVGGSADLEAGTILHDNGTEYVPLSVTSGTPDTVTSADAVLYAGVDTTVGSVEAAIIARDAEVDWDALSYPDGVDSSSDSDALIQDIKDKLAAQGIIVR